MTYRRPHALIRDYTAGVLRARAAYYNDQPASDEYAKRRKAEYDAARYRAKKEQR